MYILYLIHITVLLSASIGNIVLLQKKYKKILTMVFYCDIMLNSSKEIIFAQNANWVLCPERWSKMTKIVLEQNDLFLIQYALDVLGRKYRRYLKHCNNAQAMYLDDVPQELIDDTNFWDQEVKRIEELLSILDICECLETEVP